MKAKPYQVGSIALHRSVLALNAHLGRDYRHQNWQDTLDLLPVIPDDWMGELARKAYREYRTALMMQQLRRLRKDVERKLSEF